jgi:hypothetical protein
MNDKVKERGAQPNIASDSAQELNEFRTAQERARKLRDEAIARERARVETVTAALEITPEELLGLPARKRRRSQSQ